ncbi:hypothetical protein [Microbispora sp. CA-102843]|uniref:hypothetical protein n=1 Tax=Microbispora sp. CA-102843 TaxID=3239952 RepID=UPI003D8B745E
MTGPAGGAAAEDLPGLVAATATAAAVAVDLGELPPPGAAAELAELVEQAQHAVAEDLSRPLTGPRRCAADLEHLGRQVGQLTAPGPAPGPTMRATRNPSGPETYLPQY